MENVYKTEDKKMKTTAKKLIVMNWKMNPVSLKEAENIFELTADLAKKLRDVEVVICPPFVYLTAYKLQTKSRKVFLGAQDCFWENKGAYTGEVSPLMLKNLGIQYVIIGHSERRALGEGDEIANKKIKAGLKAGLKIIFCVGEKERNEAGDYFDFIKKEIENGLRDISAAALKNIIIAYEPIWATSSHHGAEAITPNNLQTIVIFIRKVLFNLYQTKKIFDVSLFYGGSVDGKNFRDFLGVEDVSGLLIGGASLKPKELNKIFQNL